MRLTSRVRTNIPTMNEVSDEMGIVMEYPASGDHVPKAEQNNCVIGKRVCVAYHCLPYRALPKVLWKYLTIVSVAQLNLFPVKDGVSDVFSPFTILKKRPVDYDVHGKFPFGTYVLANQENKPQNDNRPRALDGIYLRPTVDRQNGHEVMNLATGQVVVRPRVWKVPLTPSVLRTVHCMAKRQGMTSLKLLGRNKLALVPADWVAGVDYTEDKSDSNNSDHSSSDDDDDDDSGNNNNGNNDNLSEGIEDIEQEEIDDILNDEQDNRSNPTTDNPDTNEDSEGNDDEGDDDDEPEILKPPDQNDTHHPGMITPDAEDEIETSTQDGNRRSMRDRSQPTRLTYEYFQNTMMNLGNEFGEQEWEYDIDEAWMIEKLMIDLQEKAETDNIFEATFGQQYVLQKGIKLYGQKAIDGAIKEMEQLNNRDCFMPVRLEDLTDLERQRIRRAIMLVTQKRDGTVKNRTVFDGSGTRDWISKEETASPTVTTESVMMTAAVEAKEKRDTMINDVPNAFIQALIPLLKDNDARIVMKITGILVKILLELDPERYKDYVVLRKRDLIRKVDGQTSTPEI